MRLEDVTAIVTGAAQGLGLAFSKSILEGGGRVLLTDIDDEALELTKRDLNQLYPGRVCFLHQDVTVMSSFDEAFDTANQFFKPIQANVLVNNAGLFAPPLQFFKNPNNLHWTKVMQVNITALMRGTQVALHRLSSQKGTPLIVNVSSFAGITPVVYVPAYSTSKVAVNLFTSLMGQISARTNVRVVALCPAFTDTKMGRSGGTSKVLEQMGGMMTTEYVAKGFLKCVSDDDNTGKALAVTMRGIEYAPTPNSKL